MRNRIKSQAKKQEFIYPLLLGLKFRNVKKVAKKKGFDSKIFSSPMSRLADAGSGVLHPIDRMQSKESAITAVGSTHTHTHTHTCK